VRTDNFQALLILGHENANRSFFILRIVHFVAQIPISKESYFHLKQK